MSSKKALLGAISSGKDYPSIFSSEAPTPTPESIRRYEREHPPIKHVPNRGTKLFIIEGEEIWAINEKNAKRKFEQKHFKP